MPYHPGMTSSGATEILDDLRRRGFLAGGLGVAAAIGLTACGSDEDPRGESGADDGAAAGTRTVSSVNGDIEVPADPQRVVCTDVFSMCTMFDLGLTPVGVYDAGEEYVEPHYLDIWKRIPKISGGAVAGELNLEKIAGLQPDLIIGIDALRPPYEKLRQLAPTVILPFSDYEIAWRDIAEATSQMLGQDKGLGELEQQYAAAAAAIRSDFTDHSDLRWDIVQGGFDRGSYWLYGPDSEIGRILADAGVAFASGTSDVADGVQDVVSYENISLLGDADALFYYATNDGKPANLGQDLFDQAGFRKLDVARQERLYGSIFFLPQSYRDAIAALADLRTALESLA
jgi:iron complex transport system substrate-binding protein